MMAGSQAPRFVVRHRLQGDSILVRYADDSVLAVSSVEEVHHVIDLDWMKEAYRLTRKDGASGIDGVTARDYEASLEANLLDLLERIKSGRYVAPPVRRAYIPKADGKKLRPLGIPT